MGLREDLIAEQAAYDPHGLKGAGENSAKHLHVNEPYVFQEFPKTEIVVEPVQEVSDADTGTEPIPTV